MEIHVGGCRPNRGISGESAVRCVTGNAELYPVISFTDMFFIFQHFAQMNDYNLVTKQLQKFAEHTTKVAGGF